jgi:hypothetical protein
VTVFTSAAQVHNLFTIAERVGSAERLLDWLREKTRIASIGPTTSAALAEYKLAPVIQPGHPKMVRWLRRSAPTTQDRPDYGSARGGLEPPRPFILVV